MTLLNINRLDRYLHDIQRIMPPLELRGLFFQLRRISFISKTINTGRYKTGLRIGRHRHNDLTIQHILSGVFEFSYTQTNGEEKSDAIQKDSTVIIPPEFEHSWECLQDGMMIGVHLEISGTEREKILEHIDNTANGNLIILAQKKIYEYMNKFIEFGKTNFPWKKDLLLNHIRIWIELTIGEAFSLHTWIPEKKEPQGHNRDLQRCNTAIEFIEMNYDKHITLQDIATYVAISPRYLNQLFHQYHGTSLIDYLIAFRLHQSYELLRQDKTHSVKEACYSTGFRSPSYFTKCFKKRYGKLPKDVHEERADL